MRNSFFLFFLSLLWPESLVLCQTTGDTLNMKFCLEEINFNCKGDSLIIASIYSDKRLTKDTSLIRYLLTTKIFNKKSIKRIKKVAYFFQEDKVEKIAEKDSILYCIDLAILKVFKIRFFCKTYKNNIIHRGLSLEQVYSSTCREGQVYLSFFHPRLYPALNILMKGVKKDFGCELLLIDEWDRLVEDYRRLKKLKPGSIYIK